ncbi:MAG: GNAT family N-acetyltransferase [Clostridia bacterium]|nr:GNAT family N-acetyltransferase [Clostridia bacterium]
MSQLSFIAAVSEEHFRAMSFIHALGWRTTYQDAVPSDYMAEVITDDHWVDFFREDHETGRCHGLLLYNGDKPVACCNYGPARVGPSPRQSEGLVLSGDYVGWGELISFYTHPEEKGKGYGSAVMEAALDRLRRAGYLSCFVFVLRENAEARAFYAKHGFQWDGTWVDVPFPHDTICVDLRYTRAL